MNYQELLQKLDDFGDGHAIPHEAAQRIRQLEEILAEIKSFNGLRNDRDGYLHELIEWGQGKVERPIPEEWGQDEYIPDQSSERINDESL